MSAYDPKADMLSHKLLLLELLREFLLYLKGNLMQCGGYIAELDY